MAHLTLATVSEDGRRLVLVSDTGDEFTVDVDARLRAALRGDHARLGHRENQMDSTLRPRDIQARIRAGETPEDVATAAQTTVEKIMPFAGPVLAEREHVADRAQRSSVRRRAGEPAGGARTLGEAVAAHLRAENLERSEVTWDAWRREDGRWTVTAELEVQGRARRAQFTFDAPGNYVTVENDDARWLVGEAVAEEAPAARDDLQARRRRLSSVPGDVELPLGDDAIELVRGDESRAPAGDPVEAFLDDRPGPDQAEEREAAADAAALDEALPGAPGAPEAGSATETGTDAEPAAEAAPEDEPQPEPPTRRPVKKRGGRASVPSWDEIMFGGGKQD